MVFTKRHVINKNGRSYVYYSLTRSVRIPGKSYPVHQYIKYLGNSAPGLSYKTDSQTMAFSSAPLPIITKKERITYEPMRPAAIQEIPKSGYFVEPKFDGSRSLLYITKDSAKFVNRRKVVTTSRYPELQEVYKKLRFKKSAVLDGEIAHLSKEYPYGDFKKLSMREHMIHPEEIKQRSKEIPLTFMVFDVLEVDGKPLLNTPLEERKKILNEIIPDNLKNIQEVKYKLDGKGLLNAVKKKRGEGVVFKKVDSTYEPNKESQDWLKAKLLKENDVVIVAYSKGTGKRREFFGSLIMGVWDKNHWKYVGKVGTGFNEKELKRLTKKMKKLKTNKELFHLPGGLNWIKPNIVVRVNFLRETPQGRYREPRYISERSDIQARGTHPTKIGSIKTFGSQPVLIKVIKKGRMVTTRKPEEILKLAKQIEKKLKSLSKKIILAGSIRRKKLPVDIDIVSIPKDKEKIKHLLRGLGSPIQEGEKKIAYNIKGVKTEVYFAEPKTYESILMYTTGPTGSNIINRKIAKEKGYILHQGGLFKRLPRGKSGKLIANTERGIYKALGKSYRSPKERGLPR